ncbi:M48 family metalloprotease [Candidatus Saccharibacteria bacterium]|nr:M48 family metalloprotease [Candidatus Saccharibacteria bacterium]
MYRAIAANKRNTILIMALFVGVVGAIGWAVSLYYGGDIKVTYFVFVVAGLYALMQYFAASKLAVAMTGAKQIQKRDNPRLYRIVENLAITTGMPTPGIYIIQDSSPNAFATGRDPRHAIVAATTGLIDVMDDNELEAVMAHEMGHIQNYDIRVSMITFGLVSAIGLITDITLRMMFYGNDRDNDSSPVAMLIGIVVLVLSPIVAALIQMAVSRQREYLADATSAMTTRNPNSMISALEKLRTAKPMKKQSASTSHLFINNPLKPGFVSKLFSTHPPLDDRISRLRGNEGKF